MNYTEFENKVKSMNAHDIIMSMVDGLRQPLTKIDMDTVGDIKDGICYGCAATNTILHIMEVNDDETVGHIHVRKHAPIVYMTYLLWKFEWAINHLRQGEVDDYNWYAVQFEFSQIMPMPGLVLPHLKNDYTEDELQQYEKLAKYQLTAKTTTK